MGVTQSVAAGVYCICQKFPQTSFGQAGFELIALTRAFILAFAFGFGFALAFSRPFAPFPAVSLCHSFLSRVVAKGFLRGRVKVGLFEKGLSGFVRRAVPWTAEIPLLREEVR